MTESVLSTAKKTKNLRWHVAIALTVATALNYLDRMTLPVVISQLQQKFAITEAQFGALNSLFLLAYAIMYAGGGRLAGGPRRSQRGDAALAGGLERSHRGTGA